MFMAAKLGRMVTNFEGLLPIMLLNPLVTWSCEIKRQTKTILSPLLQCLCPPHLARMWFTMRGFHLQSHMTLWLRSLARSRDTLKSYLLYNNAYGNKIWQGSDLSWAAFTHVYDHVIMWSCNITWQTKIIYPLPQWLWLPNLAEWEYTKELPSIKSQGPLIVWSCEFMWQIRSVISLLPQGLLSPNLARWWDITRCFHP